MAIGKKLLTTALFITMGLSVLGKTQMVQVKGSDTILGVTQSIAESYMEKNPKARVAVVGGGSGVGISSLINGTTNIAMASRDIKKTEIEAAKKNGITVENIVLGHDGITIVTNTKNRVTNLSTADLGKIYRGEITNWKELGGDDAKIVVLSRDSSSGTHEFFKEHVVRGGNSKGTQEFGGQTLFLASNEAIKKELKSNSNAIGYIGMGYVDSTVKTLDIDGVAATVPNVLSKKYPISREVFWITDKNMTPDVKSLVEFALSPEGQALVKEEGFVPVK